MIFRTTAARGPSPIQSATSAGIATPARQTEPPTASAEGIVRYPEAERTMRPEASTSSAECNASGAQPQRMQAQRQYMVVLVCMHPWDSPVAVTVSDCTDSYGGTPGIGKRNTNGPSNGISHEGPHLRLSKRHTRRKICFLYRKRTSHRQSPTETKVLISGPYNPKASLIGPPTKRPASSSKSMMFVAI